MRGWNSASKYFIFLDQISGALSSAGSGTRDPRALAWSCSGNPEGKIPKSRSGVRFGLPEHQFFPGKWEEPLEWDKIPSFHPPPPAPFALKSGKLGIWGFVVIPGLCLHSWFPAWLFPNSRGSRSQGNSWSLEKTENSGKTPGVIPKNRAGRSLMP